MIKKIILFIGLLLTCAFANAQDFPEKPNTIVSDFTNTLSEGDKQQLENKLVAFNDSTSTQIAAVIIKSVGDYDIAEYGALLGRKWGIGQKDKNNGILLLVALNDHKVTIQTGYGAEGALPDAITSRIIEEDIKPNFRNNDYYAGLNKATDDIIKYTKGEYKADPNQKKGGKKDDGGGAGVIIIIVIVVLVLIFRRRGGGGGGQIIGGRGGASPFWWFLAGNMLGGGGRSSGSDWGGFSGGGSSGGGGGFGGFGGGSFGGGGSSGSW
ncbi:TPM domain-containing protein [Mucilaginibacter ginkgonis]|uniref:TPM domain-containing protein n=1 Tax=Mucilaginibacter ginkgonis TaxID=2682091 RepID=A0A6I4HZ82_9SPHI|nr:TPM domain-containing protein [Mucilaginibacter ginkgonis]QQL48573.1 TPM domain-containing protein [Mucilaginibacter ginkgonis]